MCELIYKYDFLGESDIHCRECKYCGNPDKFQPFCIKSGKTVNDDGYCNYVEKKEKQIKE